MMLRSTDRAPRWVSPVIIGVQLVSVLVLLAAFADFAQPGSGFTQLIAFGSKFSDRALPEIKNTRHAVIENSSGYDGQFYSQVAMDPLLLDPALPGALDNFSYRSRRILMPAVAHVAGLGKPFWILQAYAVLNVVCWLALAVVLLRWFRPGDPDGAVRWFSVLFGAGLIYSIRNAVPDGPALLLIAIGLALVQSRRLQGGAWALALAGLTRETSILSAAILPSDTNLRERGWLRFLISGVVVVLPLALWILYVNARGAALDIERNIGARNFAFPFVGWIGAWVETFHWDDWTSRVWVNRVAMVTGLTVQMAFFLFRWRWRERVWRLGFVYALLGIFLGAAVWEGYPTAAIRVLLPLTLAFNLAVPRGRALIPLLLAGNLSVIAAPMALAAPEGLPSQLGRVTGPTSLLVENGTPCWQIEFSPEWFQVENSGKRRWRWAAGGASVAIDNGLGRSVDAVIILNLRARESCHLKIRLSEAMIWSGYLIRADQSVEIPVRLGPGRTSLEFESADRPVQASWQDARMILYRVNRLELRLLREAATTE
jgi:hypothetical protein